MIFEPAITVFECGRDNGPLSVSLPIAWATRHNEVAVVFHDAGIFGWHIRLESGAGDTLMSFPWVDNADQLLRGDAARDLPVRVGGSDTWEDMEQGWYGSATRHAGSVYLAEADFDELMRVRSDAVARRLGGERVEVDGVSIRWNGVPEALYDAAWRHARESCLAGQPGPIGRPLG